MHIPQYYVKICDFENAALNLTLIDSSTVAYPQPLPVQDVEFMDVCYVPGQHNLGSFSFKLYNTQNPTYRHLRPFYNGIDYENIVEVYDNYELKGNPAFKGVVTRPVSGNLKDQAIEGVSILKKLENRRMRRYHQLTGGTVANVQTLLKTYDRVFQDDFNRTTGFGANWSFPNGSDGWSITSNRVQRVTAAGDQRMFTAAEYTAAQWKNSKVSFDFNFGGIADGDSAAFYLYFDSNTDAVSISALATIEAQAAITVTGGVTGVSRSYPLSRSDWHHADFYLEVVNATTVRGTLDINGVEMLVDTFTVTAANSTWVIRMDTTSATLPMLLDNFVFMTLTDVLTTGTMDTTTDEFDLTFNGDTQLGAIETYMDALGWKYKVRYRAGKGNDLFDCGANIGTDFSDVLVIQEGDPDDPQANSKIVDLTKDRTAQDLATSLRVYGGAQDDTATGFVANSLANFLIYGIIEGDYSDPRVVSSAIAKIVADARLIVTAAGNVSLSGTFLNESALLGQDPIWGYAVWGDFIWGGRKEFSAGDSFYLKSLTHNIDKSVRIVGLTRRNGSPAIEVTLDYFRWELNDYLMGLYRKIQELIRELFNFAQVEVYEFTSVSVAQRRYLYLPKQVKEVAFDIIIQSGSGTISLNLNGTDVSAANGGPWVGDAHITDTTYMIPSKIDTNKPYFEVSASGASSLNLTVKVSPKVIS